MLTRCLYVQSDLFLNGALFTERLEGFRSCNVRAIINPATLAACLSSATAILTFDHVPDCEGVVPLIATEWSTDDCICSFKIWFRAAHLFSWTPNLRYRELVNPGTTTQHEQSLV